MTLTDDFCQTFPTKSSCTGTMAKFIPHQLPLGVNPKDPRVKRIVKWCAENYPQDITEAMEDILGTADETDADILQTQYDALREFFWTVARLTLANEDKSENNPDLVALTYDLGQALERIAPEWWRSKEATAER